MKKLIAIATLILLSSGGFGAVMEPGLLGEYFWIGTPVREFPELDPNQKPNLKRVDQTVAFEKTTVFPGMQFSNDFCVRWTGKIRITTPGVYTFFLESDDGSQLFIYDRKVVDAGGLHAMKEYSGDVELTAGDHNLRIEYFQGRSTLGCKLSWTSKTIPKQIIPSTALFHQATSNPTKPAPGGGLLAEYFDMQWPLRAFPIFSEYEKPTLVCIDPLIAFRDSDSFSLPGVREHFYSRWSGLIKIPQSGSYTFFLSSDDGSRLFLDGKEVIDHGGLHRHSEKFKRIDLSEGMHVVKLEYFQNEATAACILWWEGPGFKKEIVPKSAFSH